MFWQTTCPKVISDVYFWRQNIKRQQQKQQHNNHNFECPYSMFTYRHIYLVLRWSVRHIGGWNCPNSCINPNMLKSQLQEKTVLWWTLTFQIHVWITEERQKFFQRYFFFHESPCAHRKGPQPWLLLKEGEGEREVTSITIWGGYKKDNLHHFDFDFFKRIWLWEFYYICHCVLEGVYIEHFQIYKFKI